MTALGSRGAYTCARCELRQLLRGRNGSTPRSSLIALSQRRYQTTDHSDKPAFKVGYDNPKDEVRSSYGFKSYQDNIVVRRGRKRSERSEQLKIKSLDKDSEVIILRELPEYMNKRPPHRHKNDKEDHEGTAGQPTAQEIQESFSENLPPTGDEIIAAIEQHKPTEVVLPNAEYVKIKAALADSYVTPQLQLYLRKKLPLEHGSHAKARSKSNVGSKPQEQEKTKPQDGTPVTRLAISSWKPSHAKADATTMAKSDNKLSRRQVSSSSKDALIDGILRQVWLLQTEEENEKRGKVEIILSPQQWGLLNTREDKTLFAALRTRKFFQRTRFDRDPRKGALIIRGPRTEAEQVAKLFEAAFAGASSFEINLAALRDVIPQKGASDFDVRFSKTRLQEIMYMTKTFVHLDRENSTLQVAGFHKNLVEDATRLLVMMLDKPRNQTRQVMPVPPNKLVKKEPTYVAKALPSWARCTQYYRDVLQYLRSAFRSNQAQRSWYEFRPAPEALQQIKDAVQQVDKDLRRARLGTYKDKVESKYWNKEMILTPWTAKYGLLLHEMSDKSHVKGVGQSTGMIAEDPPSQSSSSPELGEDMQFAVKIPSLTTVLSHFERIPMAELGDPLSIEPRLIAKLIPSPLAESKETSTFALPTVDIEFVISRRDSGETSFQEEYEGTNETPETATLPVTPNENDESSSEESRETGHNYEIDESTKLILMSIRATMNETLFGVPLPHRAVDLQFSTKRIVEGKIAALIANAEVKQFIESIVSSMREGSELRAPPTVNMPLVTLKNPNALDSEQKAGNHDAEGEVMFPYFFAGFEHRENRRLRAIESQVPPMIWRMKGGWTVSDIEGGISGGRRLELSAQMVPDMWDNPDTARNMFVARALSMTGMIHRAQTGELKPLSGQTDRSHEAVEPVDGLEGRVIGWGDDIGVTRPKVQESGKQLEETIKSHSDAFANCDPSLGIEHDTEDGSAAVARTTDSRDKTVPRPGMESRI